MTIEFLDEQLNEIEDYTELVPLKCLKKSEF